MASSAEQLRPGPRNLITDVEGLRVGNAQNDEALSGTTVLLCDPSAVAAVDMRGGAPGTRETDALSPECLVEAVDAVVLSGGSVYGLDAASGVTAWLGARGRGYQVGTAGVRAPIVPAAILFDLGNGGVKDWVEDPPYRDLGREAAASAAATFRLGNAGAGLGATAGLLKGGLGSASIATGSGIVVGALVAANPVGSVLIPGTDRFWAAPYEIDGEFGGRGWPDTPVAAAAADPFAATQREGFQAGANTTIAVVATDAGLTPLEARRMAVMAQDGLARAIRPVHTPFDGDTVFALATGRRALAGPRAPAVAALGALAADTLARAVARAVFEARTVGAHTAYRERFG